MSNYKVRVNNEAESKEVQGLFFELGASWFCNDRNMQRTNHPYLYLEGILIKAGILKEAFDTELHSELTIPQLRDLVVLKRNSVDDATHENAMYRYIELNDVWYYFDDVINKWIKSTGGKPSYYEKLKPIKKEMEMKEYLDPDNCYALITADDEIKGDSNWIEVPNGFNFAIKNRYGIYFFESGGFHHRDLIWQRHVEKEYINRTTGEYRKTADVVTGEQWVEVSQNHNFAFKADNGDIRFSYGFSAHFDESLLWTRSLPPSYPNAATPNDQNAEIKQVRQAIKSDGGSSEYHQRKIPKKMLKRWKKSGVIEVKDVIRLFLNNDFTRGNIFKAHSRISSLENGLGKDGASKEYDLNKVLYFAKDDFYSNN